MSNEDVDRMNRAKAWCFDNKVAIDDVEAAWENAKAKDVMVVNNLSKNGKKWWWLAPHLLNQLVERYGTKQIREG